MRRFIATVGVAVWLGFGLGGGTALADPTQPADGTAEATTQPAQDPSPDPAANASDRESVVVDSCAPEGGSYVAHGRVMNTTDRDLAFDIDVFFATDAGTVVGRSRATASVGSGETEPWSASVVTDTKDARCVIGTVTTEDTNIASHTPVLSGWRLIVIAVLGVVAVIAIVIAVSRYRRIRLEAARAQQAGEGQATAGAGDGQLAAVGDSVAVAAVPAADGDFDADMAVLAGEAGQDKTQAVPVRPAAVAEDMFAEGSEESSDAAEPAEQQEDVAGLYVPATQDEDGLEARHAQSKPGVQDLRQETAETETAVPETVEAATVESAAQEPVVSEPVVLEPAVAEPVVEPVAPEPAVVEPVVLEPAALEPAVVEPVAFEPAASEPSVVASDDDWLGDLLGSDTDMFGSDAGVGGSDAGVGGSDTGLVGSDAGLVPASAPEGLRPAVVEPARPATVDADLDWLSDLGLDDLGLDDVGLDFDLDGGIDIPAAEPRSDRTAATGLKPAQVPPEPQETSGADDWLSGLFGEDA